MFMKYDSSKVPCRLSKALKGETEGRERECEEVRRMVGTESVIEAGAGKRKGREMYNLLKWMWIWDSLAVVKLVHRELVHRE